MNLRTLAVVGLVLSLPMAAAAQEHKCACCAKGGHDHAAAQPPSATPPAAHIHPQASVTAPPYDSEYEGMISGVIQSVMRHSGMDVQLTLGMGERTVEVLVAPMAWLDAKQAVLRTGDRIHVVGSPQGSGDIVIARELRTADQTIVVRDTEGRPLWN